uniref:PHB domain-containing protein n=1 Tax=Macrostomum lignano TaxID=282301 RepID=A0A1I8FCY0_9PLAT
MNPQISVAACLVGVFAWACFMGLHMVPEGYVGVYYRAGALLQTVSQPGMHVMFPLITSVRHVQVTLQTDEVKNVPCGTSGGVLIYFERIEVVNILDMESAHTVVKKFSVDYDRTLIYNKIHHELNQFCSVNTLQDVYIKKFAQRVEEKTGRDQSAKKAVINAEKAAQISRIEWEMKITQKESEKKISEDRGPGRSRPLPVPLGRGAVPGQAGPLTASSTGCRRRPKANKLRLTPEFLEYTRLLALFNNTKIYFGQSIPTMLSENVMLSAGPQKAGPRRHRWEAAAVI